MYGEHNWREMRKLRPNWNVFEGQLHASAERPGRHGGSLAAADELWPALLTKVVKLYGSYGALDGGDLVRHA